jgi:membrane fusion protein (multidrug efflux system)
MTRRGPPDAVGPAIMAATVSTPSLPHLSTVSPVSDADESGPRAALTSTNPPRKVTRARVLLPSLIVVAAAVGSAVYVSGRGHESTDDAQVEGRVASVSARVSGQVSHVLVQDNQIVNAGDPLVELDDADLVAKRDAARADLAQAQASERSASAQLALTKKNADAGLTQAQGGLTQATSTVSASQSSVDQARADVTAAESRLALAKLEVDRMRNLVASSALSQAELDTKEAAYDQAVASLAQVRARVASMQASVATSSGGVVAARGRLVAAQTGPEQVDAAKAAVGVAQAHVAQTEAALRTAELNESYAVVRAPVRGVVSKRTVEAGQLVGPDRTLLAIVPLDDVWVVANFKEDQLADMRAGQPVKVKLDTFGRREFTAHLDSIAGASGARFALLPPDNATGNFVKVVQRVPVLVRLDSLPSDVTLRPGMSADVTVDTRAH